MVKKRKRLREARRKAGKTKRKAPRPLKPAEGVEYVEVSRPDYKHAEGFCRICGAKIYGDIPLIHHISEKHEKEVTISKYLSMDEEERFKTIKELTSKYLTLSQPKWYRKLVEESFD